MIQWFVIYNFDKLFDIIIITMINYLKRNLNTLNV